MITKINFNPSLNDLFDLTKSLSMIRIWLVCSLVYSTVLAFLSLFFKCASFKKSLKNH